MNAERLEEEPALSGSVEISDTDMRAMAEIMEAMRVYGKALSVHRRGVGGGYRLVEPLQKIKALALGVYLQAGETSFLDPVDGG